MRTPTLVLNCGSSSIKFALFDAAVEPCRARAAKSPSPFVGESCDVAQC